MASLGVVRVESGGPLLIFGEKEMGNEEMRSIDTVFNHATEWIISWLDEDGFILLSIMTDDLVKTVTDPNFAERGGVKTYSIVVKQV